MVVRYGVLVERSVERWKGRHERRRGAGSSVYSQYREVNRHLAARDFDNSYLPIAVIRETREIDPEMDRRDTTSERRR